MDFLTNYYVFDENRENYNAKELDLYYIGALGGYIARKITEKLHRKN